MRRALLLSGALLLTACGAGEDDKKQYVADAKAICEKAAAESEKLTVPTTPDGFADYADELVALAEDAQADLAELEPPADDKDELQKRVLDPFADVVEEGRQFAQKVEDAGGDQSKLLPLLSQLPDAGEVDLEYLRDYGLGTCADLIDQKSS